MTLQCGQTLSHYRLVEKIGEGGMGVVWKAEDTVLGRTVAVKVLPADVARDERRRQMFLDEARLASSVSEAHIVQVFDFGREADLDFIVMEYVEGKPLSKILKGKPLAPDRVAEIGQQVARALAKAHRKGLLHRDLKPSNILLTPDGDAKVVDFGLAALFARQESTFEGMGAPLSEVETLSVREKPEERRIAGTLPYMSPEQVRGEELDARSDIFSLGVVLYETTTGQRPFAGATFPDVAKRIQEARPKPVHEVVPEVPLDLERSIHKALAAHRGDRYQTMDDLAVDLKRLARDLESGSSPSYASTLAGTRRRAVRWWAAAGAVVIVAAAASGTWMLGLWGRSQASARTILILPMEVRGQTEGADYVGRAFAEALAMNLAQSADLKILAVPEQNELKVAGTKERAQAAMGMGAGRLLTGSLTRNGNSILANLSLVETRSNRILWGTQKTDADDSLPALAVSLAREVSAQVAGAPRARYDFVLNVTGSPRMAASQELAEALGNLRRFERAAALDSTKRLIEKFPTEPDAYALRACALYYGVGPGLVDRGALDQGLRDLERIDPKNATAETIRCDVFRLDGKPKEEANCSARLLSRDDLTPAARAWALRNLAVARSAMSDSVGALEAIKEASALDPTNHFNFGVLGTIQRGMGDLAAAVISFRQAKALNPGDWPRRERLAQTLRDLGKWEEAAKEMWELCNLENHAPACGAYAMDLLRAGKKIQAFEKAKRVTALFDESQGRSATEVRDLAYSLACFFAVAGDKREALRLLKRSVDAEPGDPNEIVADPDLTSLRDDPAFRAIVTDSAKRFKPR